MNLPGNSGRPSSSSAKTQPALHISAGWEYLCYDICECVCACVYVYVISIKCVMT